MNNTKKVVVMGSFVVDLMMRADRLPVVGETVKGKSFQIGAGGKGSNQCVAAARAGAQAVMLTKLGDDDFAKLAMSSFKDNNICTDYVFTDKKLPTGAALIMVDEKTSQNKIIVTSGACDNITDNEIELSKGQIENANVFLTQLETNLDATLKSIDIAHNAKIKVILNPAPAEFFPEEYFCKIDYFTPNETEAEFFSKIKINSEKDAENSARHFLEKGVKNCIITLGEKGALICNENSCKIFPSFKVNAVDTTGAGDAFNGGLAAALAEGMTLENAIIFANATASLSVTKTGTAKSMPFREEIEKLIQLSI